MTFTEVPRIYLGVTPEAAYTFFAVFSRFEYALKFANHRHRRGRAAKPSWDSFADAIERPFYTALATPGSALSRAVSYLVHEPPGWQIKNGDLMSWSPFERREDTSDLQHIFDLIKQVRNNLFHGGKYFDSQKERDEALIGCSMTILEACVHMDTAVECAYFNIA